MLIEKREGLDVRAGRAADYHRQLPPGSLRNTHLWPRSL